MTWALVSGMSDNFINEICFFLGEGPLVARYREAGFHVTVLNWTPLRTLPVAWRLFRLLRAGRYDLVVIYGYKVNMFARWLAKAAGVPTVITAQRSIDANRRPWQSWIDRITSPMVSLYISNSQAAADLLVRRERIPPGKVITIPNGIDSKRFQVPQETRRQQRTVLGLGSDQIAVAVVANLRPMKGHDHLLEAIDRLGEAGAKVHLFFAGDGPCRLQLTELTGHLGVRDRVHFLGTRTDIPELLSAMDIFVLPSLWEGMPGAVMEAMAAGLPTIATAVGGTPELIKDGETGYLVAPGDSRDLADRLGLLVAEPEARRKLGMAGQAWIEQEFSLERMVQATEGVYHSLITQSDTRKEHNG